ncbi:HalOD1 output domain-containing protein [Natrinema halophilum]|uniref:Halobacterial output domain-containing protein n=1 Tax=Natrinema halophilum TaxID=1699371 RepID=A0A7D5KK52_9EURY|nr:HalOD1 output domain-containing protein [Natrinema halophilum]QLG50079.1 hypothetical protein HYG82_15045 [Natrinema halophilum]
MTQGAGVSVKVVDEVADREGVDPGNLQPPLHKVIDTEALDALFQSTSSTARTDGTVEFQYKGYQVRVKSSEEVEIGQTVSFEEQSNSHLQSAKDPIGD